MNDSSEPLDMGLVQTFHEVARLGSVTAAARALGRSQPAISHRLRALEADLGTRLFEKVGRHLKLTESGRRLQGAAAELMAHARELRLAVTDAQAEVAGRLTVGTFPTIGAHLLVDHTAQLLSRYPKLALTIAFDFLDPLLDQLRAGTIDVALVIAEREPRGFACFDHGPVPLSALLPADKAPAGRRAVTTKRLQTLRYLAWHGPDDPTADAIARFAHDAGLVTDTTPHIPHVETLRELVVAGAGFAVLPRYTANRAERRGLLRACPIAGVESPMHLYRVLRRGQVISSALAAFMERQTIDC